MALKRTKQTTAKTGLKREKGRPKTLLDFFKDNEPDIILNTPPDAKEPEDEMLRGNEMNEIKESNDEPAFSGNPTSRLTNSLNEDELLNATLVDYEALLRKSKQKESSEVENETAKSGSQVVHDTSFDVARTGVDARENARIAPDKSALLPLSRENKHELDVLAEIRELIKNTSSNLNKPAIDYMNQYNKLEQRHRTGLGENRVNDVTMKQVAYDEEYPKQQKEMSLWPTTRHSSTETTEAGETSLPTRKKANEESPSSSVYEDESDSNPTKSSLKRHDKLKIRLTPASRRTHRSRSSKATTAGSFKGAAVVKDIGNGGGSLLQVLMKKMQDIKERVDDENKSYSGGVSLGAVFQGDAPVKGK